MKSSARPAAVAGLFYPGTEQDCRRQVEQLLQHGAAPALPGLRGLIVPHAGYVYSGAVAACAYNALAGSGRSDRLVAILGPNHRVPVRGMALDSHSHFSTPLGDVALDRDLIAELQQWPDVEIYDAAHRDEHCIEVQLPFLQCVLGDFTLVPVLVGQASAVAVAAVIERLYQAGALVLISSDLSHFLSYNEACNVDGITAQAIDQLASDLQPQQACGSAAINGMNTFARQQGWQVQQLMRNNSGDSAGDKARVVGYGAYAYV